ncbi:msrB [Symbiodinium sp. CCMP2456]|nr:msrB [Symbiodinium sp. CCMP2456]
MAEKQGRNEEESTMNTDKKNAIPRCLTDVPFRGAELVRGGAAGEDAVRWTHLVLIPARPIPAHGFNSFPHPPLPNTRRAASVSTETTPEQKVLRQQGTEPPGSHQYDRFMPTKGHFACGGCGLPLYSADSKFRSNCGWPVFKTCYYSEEANGCHVGTVSEFGGLEIVCNRCGSHLGHVFFDAFKPDNPNGERH